MADKTLTPTLTVGDDADMLLTLLVRRGEDAAEVVGVQPVNTPEGDVLSAFALTHANDGRARMVTLIARPGETLAQVLSVHALAD